MKVAIYFGLACLLAQSQIGENARIYQGTVDQPGSGKVPYQVQIGAGELAEDGKLLDAKIMCGGTIISLR